MVVLIPFGFIAIIAGYFSCWRGNQQSAKAVAMYGLPLDSDDLKSNQAFHANVSAAAVANPMFRRSTKATGTKTAPSLVRPIEFVPVEANPSIEATDDITESALTEASTVMSKREALPSEDAAAIIVASSGTVVESVPPQPPASVLSHKDVPLEATFPSRQHDAVSVSHNDVVSEVTAAARRDIRAKSVRQYIDRQVRIRNELQPTSVFSDQAPSAQLLGGRHVPCPVQFDDAIAAGFTTELWWRATHDEKSGKRLYWPKSSGDTTSRRCDCYKCAASDKTMF